VIGLSGSAAAAGPDAPAAIKIPAIPIRSGMSLANDATDWNVIPPSRPSSILCWREPDSNHQYRSQKKGSRLLPNGDAGPVKWMESLITGRVARRPVVGRGPRLHGRLFDGGTSNPLSSGGEASELRSPRPRRSAPGAPLAPGSGRSPLRSHRVAVYSAGPDLTILVPASRQVRQALA
jgi:hypothetical protein